MVLVWHIGEQLPLYSDLHANNLPILKLAWSGVDLFFVLSGFLLGGVLIDQRGADKYWRIFYARRFFRIVPLYAVVVLSIFSIAYVGPQRLYWMVHGKVALPWQSYPIFAQNFFSAYYDSFGIEALAPTWSLAVEEQFYLVLPALIWLFPSRLLPLGLVAGICTTVLFRSAVYHWFSDRHFFASYLLLPCRADALLMGVLCSYLRRKAPNVTKTTAFNVTFAALFVAWLLLAWLSGFQTKSMVLFGGLTALAAFYGALLLAISSQDWPALSNAFSFAPLRSLGKIAYGVYLLHLPIIGLTFGVITGGKPIIEGAQGFAALVASLVIVMGLSWLSFKYLELPIQRVGRRWFPVEPT